MNKKLYLCFTLCLLMVSLFIQGSLSKEVTEENLKHSQNNKAHQGKNTQQQEQEQEEATLGYSSKLTHLVDFTPEQTGMKNFLFRTNSLLNHETGKFDYEALKNDLLTQAQTYSSTPIPKDIYIIDVSLLNEENGDGPLIELEKRFWRENPSKGEFMHFPVQGVDSELYYHALPKSVVATQAKEIDHWYRDHLEYRIHSLHQRLYTKRDKPTFIIVHCKAGKDKTGMISSAYVMRYFNVSFWDSMKWNNHVSGKELSEPMRESLRWYCLSLSTKQGGRIEECIYETDAKSWLVFSFGVFCIFFGLILLVSVCGWRKKKSHSSLSSSSSSSCSCSSSCKCQEENSV